MVDLNSFAQMFQTVLDLANVFHKMICLLTEQQMLNYSTF